MKIIGSIAVVALMAAASTAQAEGWRFGLGPSYISGFKDVTDLYEDNLEADGYYDVDAQFVVPIGIAFAADYHWNSGVRVDIGLGPMSFIAGDADHFEIPITATVGYTFAPNASASPYLRAGFAHHFASGDYYVSSDPGLFAAAGIDFARGRVAKFTFEVAADQSEVEFDTYTCDSSPFSSNCRADTVKLNTYDIIASLYVKF